MHVSAVICTRNRPDLIGTAVASVLANTYPAVRPAGRRPERRRRAPARSCASWPRGHPNLRYLHTSTPACRAPTTSASARRAARSWPSPTTTASRPPDWIESIVDAPSPPSRTPTCCTARCCCRRRWRPHRRHRRPWPSSARSGSSRRDGFRIYGMGANFARPAPPVRAHRRLRRDPGRRRSAQVVAGLRPPVPRLPGRRHRPAAPRGQGRPLRRAHAARSGRPRCAPTASATAPSTGSTSAAATCTR